MPDHIQTDEFRFFKRHGMMPTEALASRTAAEAEAVAHEREVDRNNKRPQKWIKGTRDALPTE
jgi:hypothetical protein